ncbi:MAG: class I SAM-dependent methyltransferase [Cyanobacteria bacterium M_surface_7_m2_040]|nr:class I SAM-dependent methyltransferase [Cyanobacteria bacterium K_Offshore_0m_m2_072]MBM5826983.1 class I SAM-dependent methyltransferase [Cyanobacteria bacterium M_surface_7_m2_040]
MSASSPGSYDLIVQQLVPGYASLARLSVALLAASAAAGRPGASVLVAGCGTGAELLEARAQRPDWQLTAIDPSAAMLTAAQQRLGQTATAEASPAIRWQQSTVEALDAEAAFDGALSVLVLQSLADDGSKLAFLTALARSLRPGGQLVLVDLMAPERSPLQQQVDAAWIGFQAASGVNAAEAAVAGLTQGIHPIGSSRLAALVEAAGLSDPAPIFQALNVQGFLLQKLP